jgi:hypothetical protein
MAYDRASRKVVLFSGIRGDGSAPLTDTWTWDGCGWTELHPPSSPPGRSAAAMAFDQTSGKLVLFGGGSANSDPSRNDTWTWDGRTWNEEHPTSRPALLNHPKAEYDRGNHTLVLFGSPLRGGEATWTWDGKSWSAHHPSKSPPVRDDFGLAFGAKSGTLLFGGFGGAFAPQNDTWVWDGNTWSQRHPPSSPQGGPVFMVHEDAREDVAMVEEDGTWIWSGENWTQQHPSAAPPFELFRSIAYDGARNQVVLFGGKDPQSNGPTGDTWTWNGATWTRR